jgi:hypothetical protein
MVHRGYSRCCHRGFLGVIVGCSHYQPLLYISRDMAMCRAQKSLKMGKCHFCNMAPWCIGCMLFIWRGQGLGRSPKALRRSGVWGNAPMPSAGAGVQGAGPLVQK